MPSTYVYASYDDEDGQHVDSRAYATYGADEAAPAWDHGGLPADGIELDRIEVHHLGVWRHVDDLPWIDRSEVEDYLYEAAIEGRFVDERNI